jgi:hypothetical protein
MHAEIEVVQLRVLDLYAQHRAYLNSKPTPFLEELLHRSADELAHASFSVRTAAQINHAAATLLLEGRAR